MIVQRGNEIEEHDLGALLGKPDIGIKSQQLLREQIGKNGQGRLLDLKYILVRAGMVCPWHQNDYFEANIVISGQARMKCGSQDFTLGEGDIAYSQSGESYELINASGAPLKVLAVTIRETVKNSNKNKEE